MKGGVSSQGNPWMGIYTSIISHVNHHLYSYLLLYNYPTYNYFLLDYSIEIAFEIIQIPILHNFSQKCSIKHHWPM